MTHVCYDVRVYWINRYKIKDKYKHQIRVPLNCAHLAPVRRNGFIKNDKRATTFIRAFIVKFSFPESITVRSTMYDRTNTSYINAGRDCRLSKANFQLPIKSVPAL